ncbi:GNAT family N-acetyltransferase [Lysobacter humi (ex Lee et al. 2017)]
MSAVTAPQVRPVQAGDREAVLALVPRLAATGTPPGRDRAQVEQADVASLREALAAPTADAAVLVAELDGAVAGFIHVRTVRDYYTQAGITHVSDVVVAAHAEGRGIGRLLMDAAERWARDRGHALVQLYVLPENVPARSLYEKAGYRAEWLKYIKPVA